MININNNNHKLLIATTNPGKQRELRELLQGIPVELVTLDSLGLKVEVEETGSTYAENAALKAETLCRLTGLPALADDTGLEVDLLGGRPGLHSARFSPLPGATDADRRQKLLTELKGKPTPWTAHFHCTVAVAFPGEQTRLFDGDVFGEIFTEERGDHGFGYDRIFYIPDAGKSLAEIDLEYKNEFSHRAVAVRKAIPFLLEKFRETST
jgi:XTP/dITP diphosphohydrolase